MISRETIYAALFSKVSAAASFVTSSRKLRHWSEVKTAEKPSLCQAQGDPKGKTQRGFPTVWTLPARLYIYVDVGTNPDAVPSSVLNPLVDAVEAALAADPATGVQNLGLSNVSHCVITDIETDEGTLGSQAVAIIGVEIVAS